MEVPHYPWLPLWYVYRLTRLRTRTWVCADARYICGDLSATVELFAVITMFADYCCYWYTYQPLLFLITVEPAVCWLRNDVMPAIAPVLFHWTMFVYSIVLRYSDLYHVVADERFWLVLLTLFIMDVHFLRLFLGMPLLFLCSVIVTLLRLRWLWCMFINVEWHFCNIYCSLFGLFCIRLFVDYVIIWTVATHSWSVRWWTYWRCAVVDLLWTT